MVTTMYNNAGYYMYIVYLVWLSCLPLLGPVTCSPNQWQCVGTSHCLNMTQVCDGNDDCGDNSDEGTHCCKCVVGLTCAQELYIV